MKSTTTSKQVNTHKQDNTKSNNHIFGWFIHHFNCYASIQTLILQGWKQQEETKNNKNQGKKRNKKETPSGAVAGAC